MNQRVLIGFADALAAIESAWCLADDGFDVHVFARQGTRPALARSKSVSIVSVTAPEEDTERSAADLAAVIKEIQPAVVLPLDDHAVWLCNRISRDQAAAPSRNGHPIVIAGPANDYSTSLALDKRQQLVLAEKAGFAVPASRDAASEQPPGRGPWMVKPALAIELRGAQLERATGRAATSHQEVREVLATIGGPAIVQPLLSGTGEGIFGIATANGATAMSAHRRIRMMNPRGSGSSACQSIPVAEELVRPVSDFIAASDWRGLFMIELLRDEAGEPWFMELNGRAWGSMALACRRGFPYPAWAVHAALDSSFEPTAPVTTRHLTARHFGREIVHLGAVMARGGAPRLSTARDVLTIRRDERWYNLRRGQKSVFAADTWDTVRRQLFRRRSA
jgi:hypothetical protein